MCFQNLIMAALCCLGYLQCLRLPGEQRASAHGSTVKAFLPHLVLGNPQVLHPGPCRRGLALRLLLRQGGGSRVMLNETGCHLKTLCSLPEQRL